eukprot:10365377-Lingulodinium_polyedra.AAC.1
MMRLKQRCVAAAGRNQHARAFHARASLWSARSARACGLRAGAAAQRQIDRIIARRFRDVA